MAAPEGNTYAEGHGRPTDYKPEYDQQAYKLCLLGHTDDELADFFGVTKQTVNNWKQQYPSFFDSLKRGKDFADAEVAASFFKRATGYQYNEVTREGVVVDDGVINPDEAKEQLHITKIVTKELPPDAGAALSWLKNRKPKKWRDKQVVEIQNTVTDEDLQALSDEQMEALLAAKQTLAKRHDGPSSADQ